MPVITIKSATVEQKAKAKRIAGKKGKTLTQFFKDIIDNLKEAK